MSSAQNTRLSQFSNLCFLQDFNFRVGQGRKGETGPGNGMGIGTETGWVTGGMGSVRIFLFWYYGAWEGIGRGIRNF